MTAEPLWLFADQLGPHVHGRRAPRPRDRARRVDAACCAASRSTGRSCTSCCPGCATSPPSSATGPATCAPTPTGRRWSRSGGPSSCTSRPRTPRSRFVERLRKEGLVAEILPTPTFALSRAEFTEWAGDREHLPDGGLLPRPAASLRRADGRRRARRRQVEPRPRQPRAATRAARRRSASSAPWQPREDAIDDAGPGRPRRPRPADRRPRRAALVRRHGGRGAARAARTSSSTACRTSGRTRTRCCTATGRWRTRCSRCRSTSACCTRSTSSARPRPRFRAGDGAARERRGLRPAGARLAGVHVAPVLALRARLPAAQRAARAHAAARLVAPRWTPTRSPPACLRSALEGVRDRGWTHHIQRLMVLGNHALQRGYRPARAVGLVPRGVRRRLRVGHADQRDRHEPARRRRHARDQAVRVGRGVHQPDVRPLRRLRVRPAQAARRRRLPVHGGLLGLGAPPPRAAGREQPDASARWRRWTGWPDLDAVLEQESAREAF